MPRMRKGGEVGMRLGDIDAVTEKLLHDSFCSWHDFNTVMHALDEAPTIDAVPVVRCKDCKWWDKRRDSPYGYCHACKHGHRSEHWEIGIYRVYKGDWFCADGERRDYENGEDA